jgi:ProP effector
MTSPETESAATPPPQTAMTVPQCAALLREHFPALFDGPAKPLKLRIQADINERQPGVFPKQALSAFLRRHTMSDAYLKAMGQSQHRFDLDGQPAGEVSEEHRKIALATLEERRSRQQAARAAVRDQQRDAQRDAQREAERAARREAQRAEKKAAAVAERSFRAALLRDFETTTLTRENFCALKGVEPAKLDELLVLAQQDRDQRRAFVNELASEFKASGKNVADFAATKNMHPAQVDRFLREAGAIGGGGGRRPERSERNSPGRRG